MTVAEQSAHWMVTGFQAQVFLWCWTALVLLYGLYRSFGEGRPDPIRPAGPGA